MTSTSTHAPRAPSRPVASPPQQKPPTARTPAETRRDEVDCEKSVIVVSTGLGSSRQSLVDWLCPSKEPMTGGGRSRASNCGRLRALPNPKARVRHSSKRER
ncbi:hypothetical protein DTO271G3_4348 [Paecilomyces variotii]|nr:hypothetical protein DTO271G3_4348 [Paecilomyces variotii]